MNRPLLDRRQFNARFAACAVAVSTLGARLALRPVFAAGGATPAGASRRVRFPDGTLVPALGQGAWHLGQGRHPAEMEELALHAGVALGMSLLDTSGNYGEGRSEQFIGHAIAGKRDSIYLVTKVEAEEVDGDGIPRACEASLARLGTSHIDLYLLHSPVPAEKFAGVVAAFEQLRAARKIRAWGVSNFDTDQMKALFKVPNGRRCATNQVQYSLNNRGIERDLLPWCAQHKMPVMAYSPLGGDNSVLLGDRTLGQIAAAHQCSAAAVALAWVIRSGTIIGIPESGSPAHVKDNAAALSLTLNPGDLETLGAAFPPSRT